MCVYIYIYMCVCVCVCVCVCIYTIHMCAYIELPSWRHLPPKTPPHTLNPDLSRFHSMHRPGILGVRREHAGPNNKRFAALATNT